MIALYPGSFDPPHLGHIDLIRRAAPHCTRLVVGLAGNPRKTPFLPTEVRLALLAGECASLPNVSVVAYAGQTVAYARSVGATVLVRGLRHHLDLEAERGLATVNREAGGLETLFLITSGAVAHLSSDLVRQAVAAGMPVAGLVPASVAEALRKRG